MASLPSMPQWVESHKEDQSRCMVRNTFLHFDLRSEADTVATLSTQRRKARSLSPAARPLPSALPAREIREVLSAPADLWQRSGDVRSLGRIAAKAKDFLPDDDLSDFDAWSAFGDCECFDETPGRSAYPQFDDLAAASIARAFAPSRASSEPETEPEGAVPSWESPPPSPRMPLALASWGMPAVRAPAAPPVPPPPPMHPALPGNMVVIQVPAGYGPYGVVSAPVAVNMDSHGRVLGMDAHGTVGYFPVSHEQASEDSESEPEAAPAAPAAPAARAAPVEVSPRTRLLAEHIYDTMVAKHLRGAHLLVDVYMEVWEDLCGERPSSSRASVERFQGFLDACPDLFTVAAAPVPVKNSIGPMMVSFVPGARPTA